MTKRIFTQLTFIVAVLALIAVGEEKPLSLADTKWKLVGFVDVGTGEFKEPDYMAWKCEQCPRPIEEFPWISTEDWFTLRFNDDPGEAAYFAQLSTTIVYGDPALFRVDYTKSTITFGTPGVLAIPYDVPSDIRFYWGLVGAQTFELTDNSLKIYYLARFLNKETWEETWSDTVVGYLLFKPWTTSKVLDANRTVLQPKSDKDVTIALLPPEIILSPTNFTAGPNPISKSAALVNFYRVGKQVKTASLKIYDVSGKTINKISISDKSAVQNARSKRQVGSWNLKDAKGRPVSEGTYLVKGTVKTVDRKSEKISLLISVR